MVGLIDKEEHITTQWFKNEGDVIILVGAIASTVAAGADRGDEKTGHDKEAEASALGYSLGGSRYLKVCHGFEVGPPPCVYLAYENKIQKSVGGFIREGVGKNTHEF